MNLDKPLLMLVTSASQMGQGQQTGLWLEEFAIPYQIFRDNKVPVRVASPNGGKVPIDPRSVPDDEQKAQWKDAIAELRNSAGGADQLKQRLDDIDAAIKAFDQYRIQVNNRLDRLEQ